MKRYGIVAIASLVLVLSPLVASGATFLSAERELDVPATQDDVYAASDKVTVPNVVGGDLFVAGENVEVTGNVGQDVYVVGREVSIQGTVGDDIFAAGSDVFISSARAGDIFAAGNTVVISADTTAEQGAYLAGGTVEIAGTYRGTVRISAAEAIVKEGTVIEGDLITYGTTQPLLETNVRVAGQTRHIFQEREQESTRDMIMDWVRSVVTWFVAATVLLYLLPGLTRHTIERVKTRPLLSLGIAAAWLVLLLPVTILLFITIIGIPLAVALWLLTVLLMLAAIAYANITLGDFVLRKALHIESPLNWQHVLFGTVLFQVLSYIPWIGDGAALVLVLFSFGALCTALWGHVRPKGNLTSAS